VYIKDVKSSNGTFVNGARLSPEGVASAPFEVHTGDVLEFGVDIMNDDSTAGTYRHVRVRLLSSQEPDCGGNGVKSTVLYQKVSCKIVLQESVDNTVAQNLNVGTVSSSAKPAALVSSSS
jgi:hypothetical protein